MFARGDPDIFGKVLKVCMSESSVERRGGWQNIRQRISRSSGMEKTNLSDGLFISLLEAQGFLHVLEPVVYPPEVERYMLS